MKEEKKKEFNIFKHELVPKHVLLNRKEFEEIMEKYHIRAYQLPYIKASDPAVRAIEAKPGDVLKIVRRSSTAGEVVVFRYVIED